MASITDLIAANKEPEAASAVIPKKPLDFVDETKAVALPKNVLDKFGLNPDLSNIGVNYTLQSSEEGESYVPSFYNKDTGKTFHVLPGLLGNTGYGLGVDKKGNIAAYELPKFGSFFEELAGGIGDLASDPGFLLAVGGPLAGMGLTGTGLFSSGAGAFAPTAEAGMTDALFAEGISAGVGEGVGGVADLVAGGGGGSGGLGGVNYSLSSGRPRFGYMGGTSGLNQSAVAGLESMGRASGLNTSGILSGIPAMGGAQGLSYINPATGALTNAAGTATTVADILNLGKGIGSSVMPLKDAANLASKVSSLTGGDKKDASGIFGTGLSGAGLLAGIGGLAGLIKLIQEDNKRYGVPGRQDTFNPLGGYKFSPSAYQSTIADPAMFRPRAMAEGGKVKKPQYTGKAALGAMDPYQRTLAELNNLAYAARMPAAMAYPQTNVSQMGQFAAGGLSDLGGYSDGGRMLKGPGDGMSDSIPASIEDKRPARLADNEFVVPADVVADLGNGSSDAGARQLYKMMDRVRMARHGTKKQGREIDPMKHMPA